MGRRFSPLFYLFLLLVVTPAFVAAPPWSDIAAAHAADDDDDDDDDGKKGGGGDDDDDDDDDGGEADKKEKQPPVTSGGLFTKKTFPIALLDRPLTITKDMLEVRGGLDIDVSDQRAFEIWRVKANGRYGLQDNIELQAAFSSVLTGELPPGSNLIAASVGIESAIAYDVVDFRATLEFPIDPDFQMDLALGFPVRYRIKPNIALIALDRIMTIHFRDAKPDLTIGVGGIFQVIPKLAIFARGVITIPEFNTETITIPVTAAVLFSPQNNFDIGGEFTLGDVKNSDDPLANRSLLLFAQLRM